MAVKSYNESVHRIIRFSPNDLWTGNQEILKLAEDISDQERERCNQKRKVFPVKFYPSQIVS